MSFYSSHIVVCTSPSHLVGKASKRTSVCLEEGGVCGQKQRGRKSSPKSTGRQGDEAGCSAPYVT